LRGRLAWWLSFGRHDDDGFRLCFCPAEDLALDARQYDKQLLDPKAGQLQLLVALMQVNAWDAAMLMMQWLQVGAESVEGHTIVLRQE
jgi:hypothetical protein